MLVRGSWTAVPRLWGVQPSAHAACTSGLWGGTGPWWWSWCPGAVGVCRESCRPQARQAASEGGGGQGDVPVPEQPVGVVGHHGGEGGKCAVSLVLTSLLCGLEK